ncbi:MAG: YceI family protein [Alphaproteobacteria bacterium]
MTCVCLYTAAPAFEENEAAGDYVLDQDHAALLWKVNHLGFSDYVGRFNSFDAELSFDPEFPTAAKLEVTVDAASLDVNNPDFARELRGEKWFDVRAHPGIRFVSTGIEQTGPETGKVTGNLTLMGRTRPVTLDVELTGQGRHIQTGLYTLGFKATGTVDRTDFGLDRMTPLIGSDVTLEIHAEFTQR